MPIGVTPLLLAADTVLDLSTDQSLAAGEKYTLVNLSDNAVYYTEIPTADAAPTPILSDTDPWIPMYPERNSGVLTVAEETKFYVFSPGNSARIRLVRG